MLFSLLIGGIKVATAVICEFNPFHNGHKYLLEKAKKITGQPIIAIMSGSFTQRGEVAVTDKFSRAKIALENGADLVVELPTVYAVSNAQRFASCGVHIAKAFDCVDALAFGCESESADLLLSASNAVEDERVSALIKDEMKSGNYYPRALENAVRTVFGDETADVLTSPNNILAVEYIKSLGKGKVKPLPILRTGVDHDSEVTVESFASASQVRKMLRAGESAESFVPTVPCEITYPKLLERAVICKLRSMQVEDFAKLADIGEGLENRIYRAVNECNSLEAIIDFVKTKRYTHARIRRIITSAFLGITEEMQNTPVEYARVLGFTKAGASLLKSCRLEVVTSVSEGLKNGGNIEKLLKADVLATDISALAYKNINRCGIDYTTPVIKLN